MSPQIHFDPSKAVSFDTVAPGTYPVRVFAVSDVEQGPKAKYLSVEFEHLDPELAGKAGHIWRNYPIEGKGAGFFKDLWKKAVGEDLSELTQLDTDDLVGKEITVELSLRPADDEEGWPERNEIKKVIG